MSVISFVFYCLNNYFESRLSDGHVGPFLPSDRRQDFKADFRTLPHTLPGGRRRLIVLVESKWNNFDRRLAIRNSWGLNQHRLNCSVFFVVGDSDDESMGSVTDEGTFFHDVIQPTVWENDQNLVLKLLAAFRFVETELDSEFVMKTNDDVFVNLPELVDFLQPYVPVSETEPIQNQAADDVHVGNSDSERPHKLIFGNRVQKATPRGDQENFWMEHVPFPDYVSSAGYVFSFDVLRRFTMCPKLVDLIPLEDVFFTGICRHHFGLPLEHNDKFAPRPNLNVPCLWKTKFVTAGVRHHEMEIIWTAVNKKSTPKC